MKHNDAVDLDQLRHAVLSVIAIYTIVFNALINNLMYIRLIHRVTHMYMQFCNYVHTYTYMQIYVRNDDTYY